MHGVTHVAVWSGRAVMCSVFVCSNVYGIGTHVMQCRMDT